MEGYAVTRGLEIIENQNTVGNPDHSTGTRSFSSSNQLMTMMILRNSSSVGSSSARD
jgi:hypothetical protein